MGNKYIFEEEPSCNIDSSDVLYMLTGGFCISIDQRDVVIICRFWFGLTSEI